MRKSALHACGVLALLQSAMAEFKVDRSVMSDRYWDVWGDAEQARIDTDIERNRKADASVRTDAPSGTVVKVEQLTHDFVFGGHIFNFNQLGKREDNDAYKRMFGRGGLFNSATVAFYWVDYEPTLGHQRFYGDYEDTERFWNTLSEEEAMKHRYWRRPSPAPVINFCKRRGLRVHGHVLVWGGFKPSWLFDDFCPPAEMRMFEPWGLDPLDLEHMPWCDVWKKVFEARTEREVAALAPTLAREFPRLFRARVKGVAERFGPVVDSWDVVNESAWDWEVYRRSRTGLPFWNSHYGIMPGDYPLHAMLDAKAAFPDRAKLNINDWKLDETYLAQIADLEREGARIDIVGCQMHIFKTNDCMRLAQGETDARIAWMASPGLVREKLDLMARSGKPLHVSEVTIPAPGADDRARMIQAVLVRNAYRIWFSHPATMGITWWNSVDGGGIWNEPRVSGLFTRDMRRKPAYEALDQLVNREWKTRLSVAADGSGRVSFRGFRGHYRLSWKDAAGAPVAKFFDVR